MKFHSIGLLVPHLLLTTTTTNATEEKDSILLQRCDSEDKYWIELTSECQQYLTSRGYTVDTWDADAYWDELPPAQRDHWINNLGHTEDDWWKTWSWEEIPTERRYRFQFKEGWNKDAWETNDESLKSFVNEEELSWEELPPERLEYWIERGYDAEKWEGSEEYDGIEKRGTEFDPVKLTLSVPELEGITLDSLAAFDTDVGLRDGYTVLDNESYIDKMHIREYVRELRNGNTRKYLAMEDLDPYKMAFEEAIGGRIYKYLFRALNATSELREKGFFTPERWNAEHYDWAMFAGSKGTSTSMHYDNDLFNFLWVSEGRKRIVLIPNDERTIGKFDIASAFSGTAHTGLDILRRDVPLPELAVEVEIGPGEGLYFPYMCWHAVENLEDTLAFGWRVKDGY